MTSVFWLEVGYQIVMDASQYLFVSAVIHQVVMHSSHCCHSQFLSSNTDTNAHTSTSMHTTAIATLAAVVCILPTE